MSKQASLKKAGANVLVEEWREIMLEGEERSLRSIMRYLIFTLKRVGGK